MLTWTVSLDGGPRRVNHAAVVAGFRIYTFGGFCSGEDYETTRPMDVHVLNTISLRWAAVPNKTNGIGKKIIPYQRYGHTAVAHDDKAYIWGGRNDSDGACNKLYGFDTKSQEWIKLPKIKGPIPGARDGHSACIINSKMYIFGGYEEAVDKFSNEVHALDFATLTWALIETRGSPASWRDFHSATCIGDKMFVFGGRSDLSGPFHTNSEVYCNKLQVMDTAHGLWYEPECEGNLPIGRRSHSAFEYQGNLYVFGGYNGLSDRHFADLFKFDPRINCWSTVSPKGIGPCPRRRQCCCVINDKVYFFGGTCACKDHPPTTESELTLQDHADLHVLDLAPTLKTLCMITVIAEDLDATILPSDIRCEILAMTTNSTISKAANTSG